MKCCGYSKPSPGKKGSGVTRTLRVHTMGCQQSRRPRLYTRALGSTHRPHSAHQGPGVHTQAPHTVHTRVLGSTHRPQTTPGPWGPHTGPRLHQGTEVHIMGCQQSRRPRLYTRALGSTHRPHSAHQGPGVHIQAPQCTPGPWGPHTGLTVHTSALGSTHRPHSAHQVHTQAQRVYANDVQGGLTGIAAKRGWAAPTGPWENGVPLCDQCHGGCGLGGMPTTVSLTGVTLQPWASPTDRAGPGSCPENRRGVPWRVQPRPVCCVKTNSASAAAPHRTALQPRGGHRPLWSGPWCQCPDKCLFFSLKMLIGPVLWHSG
nr:uncharacterized protein LOC127485978 [Oryctolagus cuniculus]